MNPMDLLQERIEAALERLIDRDVADAFVILEDRSSGQFVQFAGGTDRGLLFDLPLQALNPEEKQRTVALLALYDIPLETGLLYDRPGGRPVGIHQSFQVDLERDVERATVLALRVFQTVYQVGADFPLEITEH